MNEWWSALDGLNKSLYIGAAFFSLLFIWQFLSALIGLAGEGGDADMDVDVDVDMDGLEGATVGEAAESMAAFKILSIRAILAFCTLFCWAGAMYLDSGKDASLALAYATGWGLAAWIVVAALVHFIRRLAETGTPRLATCVGRRGTVYLNVPEAGFGEVRVTVSGVVTRVKARAAGSTAIAAGTPVRVTQTLDANTVEVETLDATSGE